MFARRIKSSPGESRVRPADQEFARRIKSSPGGSKVRPANQKFARRTKSPPGEPRVHPHKDGFQFRPHKGESRVHPKPPNQKEPHKGELPSPPQEKQNAECRISNNEVQSQKTTDFQNLRQGTYPTSNVTNQCRQSHQILEIYDKTQAQRKRNTT